MSDLPKGWEASTLVDLVTFNPKHDPETNRDQVISFVPMPAVNEHSGTISEPKERPLAEMWKGFTHFADGDVIFAKITPCMENGKTAIARDLKNGIACGSTEFHVLRPSEGILADYLWRYMRQKSFRDEAAKHMTGAVGQRRVPKPYLEQLRFPLPPLAEQRRIVEKLDQLSARTRAAKDHLTHVQTLATRAKQATLAAAFRGKWDTRPLSDLASVGTGATPKKGNARFYDSGNIPWVTSSVANQDLVTEAEQYITEAAIKETNCRVYPSGTLLVAMYGEGKTRGMITKLGIDAATNQALAAIQLTAPERVHPEWVPWLLQSKYLEMREMAAGGVQPNLNLGIIKAIEVLLPPVKEQTEIICRIEAVFARIDRMVAEAGRAAKLLERLEAQLLAEAFRGELVPQDPSDEPASALLARIREARANTPKPKRARKKRVAS
ncbi:restriction endonuclease subunit S [Phaeobacter inhibens]|uniref:restriction endonuclease subunit S n=1 Tax=Phaeobacter inhibens TaxID=221822 RepID=UPI0021A6DA4B|nr:restriction endonuclease subunit S [Phaeobacter inhibens]UWR44628.1 restriction endonuclease subunit S [Phaeobacter inhibens]